MKTVQDYKRLGLVFIQGDYINTHEGKKQEPLNRYGVGYCNDSRSNDEKFAVEFAWRNNDGVKPEYKGLIHAMFENGAIIQDVVDSLNWGISFYPIIQWRPVVLQSDDANGNKDSSFKLPIGIDSPELRDAFKSLKDHLENKPPFWNKSIKTLNCPCVAVNIKAVKPTVSPKEDKPMKPVYTAEMHARGELPPVDSKVKVCIEEAGFYVDEQDVKFEGKAVTVKAAFSNTESEKIVAVENEDGNCTCYIIECIKPIIKTIKVNGFDVPAPMSEAVEYGKSVFVSAPSESSLYSQKTWQDTGYHYKLLQRGVVHSTKSSAIAHAKSMLGIDPNA